MPFPSEKELKKVRKILNKAPATRIVGEEGTTLEKIKFQLCQNFLKYAHSNNLSQKEMSQILKADESIVSKIFRCRIESFSLDRLLGYYQIIYPNYKIKIAS